MALLQYNGQYSGLKEVAKSAGNRDKVTELESMAERLGMLLDMLAQAIKKPYQLDTEVIQLASAIKLTTAQHPVTAICLSKELDQASELEWGVTIPSMKPAEYSITVLLRSQRLSLT